MSQSPQRRKLTSQSPTRTRNATNDNRRSLRLANSPQGHRGRLPLLAVLLALAALILVPAMVFANHGIQKPSKPTATTGDGTMTVSWNNTHGASSGYQYRYTDSLIFTLEGSGTVSDWINTGSQAGDTSVTIAAGTLTVGTDYYFQVRGRAGTDTGPESDWSAGVEQRAAPAKLTNVQATAGDGEVRLSWDNPNDLTIANYGYRVDPDPSDGSSGWTDWQNFTTGDFSRTVTELTNGTTYSFQVRANNQIGGTPHNGEASETVTATPQGPPAAPQDLTAKAFDGQINVYWANPSDSDITKHQYRYSSANDSQSNPVWEPDWTDIAEDKLLGSNNLHYEQTGLTNGTLYTFEIRAVSDIGAGPSSSTTMTAASGETAPSGIINLQWTETNSRANFTWNQGDDSINKYEFRYSSSSNQFSDTDSWSNATTVNSNSVTSFSHYMGNAVTGFFQFRAVNTDAVPDATGPITAVSVTNANTPGASGAPPAVPSGLSAAPTPGQVVLTWTALDTVTGYEYRQSKDGGTNWDPDWTSSSATATHTITDLTDGTAYTFEVRAYSDAGNGAAARVGPVTPGAPRAPTELTVATADDDTTTEVDEAPTQVSLHLKWTEPGTTTGVTITGYQYRKRASADRGWGDWPDTDTTDATKDSHTVTGLSPGTSYDSQVRAMAGTIGGPESNIASGTTANPPKPGRPTGISATAVANGVKLTWDDPKDDTITVYRYRSTTRVDSGTNEPDFSGSTWTAFSNNAKQTEYTITRLTAGSTYYIQILAANANGDGPATDPVPASPRAAGDGTWTYGVILNPSDATAGDTEGVQVSLEATWTADSADRNEIVSLTVTGTGSVEAAVDLVSRQPVGFGASVSSDLGATSFSRSAPGECSDPAGGSITCTVTFTTGTSALYAKGTASGAPYSVYARLSNFSMTAVLNGVATTANTPASDPIGSLVLGEAAPQAPAGLRVTDRGDRFVTLAWTNPGNPTIDRYEYQTTSGGGDPSWPEGWTSMSRSNKNTAEYRFSGLTNNEEYHFHIRAVNLQSSTGTTQSGPSNVVSATPNPRPAAPRNLKAAPNSRLSKLTWTDPNDTSITSYEYRLSDDDGNTWDRNWKKITGSGAVTVEHTLYDLTIGGHLHCRTPRGLRC